MRRRELMTLLGGAAVAWPFAARAQQPPIPVIGFLHPTSPGGNAHRLAAFRQGLAETGFVEGRSIVIEYRWAEGRFDRLPALAAELVDRRVAVIFASPSITAILAAKTATTTIPIVFMTGSDPVKAGLVASLNLPGGNLTGVSTITVELGAKRMELLHELVPKATMIGVLLNPDSPSAESQTKDAQASARRLGLQLHVQNARREQDFEPAFAFFAQKQVGALFFGVDSFFTSQRDRIVALAERHALPTSFGVREFIEAGGLMSYGPSFAHAYRQAGNYVGQVLKGAKPGNLPVQQPTKFELVINLKTAKALGITIPESIMLRADEAIE